VTPKIFLTYHRKKFKITRVKTSIFKFANKTANIKYKKLISLQHCVRAMKSHIQVSTNHFVWDNVIARSHIALTIHLTRPYLTFALPHYHASKETEIMQTLQRL